MPKSHSIITVSEYIERRLHKRKRPAQNPFRGLPSKACANALAKACKADLRQGGSQAFYHPAGDYIQMSGVSYLSWRALFGQRHSYASTLLHELIHWTGHRKRLSRFLCTNPNDDRYAREELTADLGAALLVHDLCISNQPRLAHARYLNSWLKQCPNANVDLDAAFARANRATAYLLALAHNRGT